MRNNKAIEILTDAIYGKSTASCTDFTLALKLGSEALKRIDQCRLADHTIKEDLLPGETKPQHKFPGLRKTTPDKKTKEVSK